MTDRVPRYAVIPTHNRPEQLAGLLKSLDGHVDLIIVIDNASNPPIRARLLVRHTPSTSIRIQYDDEQPPQLYRMWNVGFNLVEEEARAVGANAWDVVVLNDDTELPDGWIDLVCQQLRVGYPPLPAVACTDPYGILSRAMLKTQPDANINTRMCPWAFVTRGEIRLRADESYHWWWGDTDFDWQACAHGGVLLLPGMTTKNTLANSTTHGVLAEQAGRDGLTFQAKRGYRPW